MSMRHVTPYSSARGLGAAGHAAGSWRAQRVSAIALVPLALWFAVTLARGAAADHAALTLWLKAPVNAILMVLLMVAAFHHAALGLQVAAEDYIHSRVRFIVIGAIHLACIAGAVIGIAAVLLIALTG